MKSQKRWEWKEPLEFLYSYPQISRVSLNRLLRTTLIWDSIIFKNGDSLTSLDTLLQYWTTLLVRKLLVFFWLEFPVFSVMPAASCPVYCDFFTVSPEVFIQIHIRSPWTFRLLRWAVPALSASLRVPNAPHPSSSLWPFAGHALVYPCLLFGEPRIWLSTPSVGLIPFSALEPLYVSEQRGKTKQETTCGMSFHSLLSGGFKIIQ